jgi:hypothetical protein
MAADEKSTLKLFFDCRFHTLHTRVPTQRPFNLIQNKVGYRNCFATGAKLEQCLWNSFDVK